jgi:hypothetical protein
VIAKVNRGSYERSRDGYLDLRLSEPGGGRPVTVRLGGIQPEPVHRTTGGNVWNLPQIDNTFVFATLFVLGMF